VDQNARIQSLAANWYQKLDNHAPAEDYASLLADEGLELRFPEGTFRGSSGFRQWYERVLGLFFDETHVIRSIDPEPGAGPEVTAKVVVRWEASTWTPPEPRSRRIKLDAYQTWVLAPAPGFDSYLIKTYVVDRMEYDPDSARL
jgi:hypothetical protein